MEQDWKDIARRAAEGASTGDLDFGRIVGLLIQAGFDGYLVDYRTSTKTYYLPDGRSCQVDFEPVREPVAEGFQAEGVREAIREAQTKAPGYTYQGFCAKSARAGCAGYLVSFPGRRVLYFGRTGETHVEHFPGTPSPNP